MIKSLENQVISCLSSFSSFPSFRAACSQVSQMNGSFRLPNIGLSSYEKNLPHWPEHLIPCFFSSSTMSSPLPESPGTGLNRRPRPYQGRAQDFLGCFELLKSWLPTALQRSPLLFNKNSRKNIDFDYGLSDKWVGGSGGNHPSFIPFSKAVAKIYFFILGRADV